MFSYNGDEQLKKNSQDAKLDNIIYMKIIKIYSNNMESSTNISFYYSKSLR